MNDEKEGPQGMWFRHLVRKWYPYVHTQLGNKRDDRSSTPFSINNLHQFPPVFAYSFHQEMITQKWREKGKKGKVKKKLWYILWLDFPTRANQQRGKFNRPSSDCSLVVEVAFHVRSPLLLCRSAGKLGVGLGLSVAPQGPKLLPVFAALITCIADHRVKK